MGTGQWGSFSFKLLTAGCQDMHFLLRSLFRQLMLFLSLSQKSNPADQNNVEITLESFTSSQSYVYHRYLTCAFLDVTLSLLELSSPILNSHVLSVRVRKTCKNWLNADLDKEVVACHVPGGHASRISWGNLTFWVRNWIQFLGDALGVLLIDLQCPKAIYSSAKTGKKFINVYAHIL